MLFLILFYDNVIKVNVLYVVIFLRHNDQIKLWIFWAQSSHGKQIVTQDLEEQMSFLLNRVLRKPYESFSCRQKRAVEQEVGTASGNSFLYLHAICINEPAADGLMSDPFTKFNKHQLNICTQNNLRCVCFVIPLKC